MPFRKKRACIGKPFPRPIVAAILCVYFLFYPSIGLGNGPTRFTGTVQNPDGKPAGLRGAPDLRPNFRYYFWIEGDEIRRTDVMSKLTNSLAMVYADNEPQIKWLNKEDEYYNPIPDCKKKGDCDSVKFDASLKGGILKLTIEWHDGTISSSKGDKEHPQPSPILGCRYNHSDEDFDSNCKKGILKQMCEKFVSHSYYHMHKPEIDSSSFCQEEPSK
jgi:hypothetical protein